jgi:LysM repeat protein
MAGSPSDPSSAPSPWAPRQSIASPSEPRKQETHDAPWSNLYEANKSTIGSNPNLIQPGMKLDIGGGDTHTVLPGETLSEIQKQYGYGSSGGSSSSGASGMHPLASEGGGASPTGGNYSENGSLKVSEGNGVPGTKLTAVQRSLLSL